MAESRTKERAELVVEILDELRIYDVRICCKIRLFPILFLSKDMRCNFQKLVGLPAAL